MDVKHSMDTHQEEAFASTRVRSDVLSAAGLSADFLELAHDLVGIGSYVLNLRTRILYISREMALLLGLDDTPLQMPLDVYRRRFYAPDRYALTTETAEEAYKHDQPLWLNTQIIRADGRAIWVRTTSVFRINDAGDSVRVGMLRDITEQHDANESIEKHTQQLREQAEALKRMASIMEHANDVILMMDENGHILEANHRAVESYGYTYDELTSMTIADLRATSTWETIPALLKATGTAEGAVFETLHRRKDGSVLPVEVNSRLIEIEGQRCRLSVIRDISQRKEHEAQIARLNRLYAAVGQINLAVVGAQSREALFTSVCNVLVHVSLFKMAWVGWKNTETLQIEAVASCGDDGQYLKTIQLYADERPEGRGPVGTAVREARTYVCNDFFADPCTVPWRVAVERHGFRSVIALPFCQGGQVVGALTAYATECNVFGEKEITLCNEAAAAITLALDKFEHEQQRAQAEARQRASDERLRVAFHSTLIAYAIMERDGRRMLDVNTRMAELFGYTREEMIGHTSVELGLYESLEERQRLNQELDEAGYVENYEVVARRKNGERFYVTLSAMGLHAAEPPLILATLIDITTRKEAELELEKHRQHLEQMVADRTERLVATNQQLEQEIVERKRTEEALRESEAKYRCLINQSSSIILEWDTEGRVLFLNAFGCAFLGFTLDEILGRNVVGTIVAPCDETGTDMVAKIEQIQKSPDAFYSSENENIRKNGEKVWIAWTNRGIYDANNRLIKTISFGIDRTRQRESEKLLHVQHHQLQEEIAKREKVEAKLRKSHAILEERVQERTYELTLANQQLFAEIAERKHAEALLRASEEQYRSIVETAQEGIFMYDANWRFVFVNKQFADLLGYTREEMVGHPIVMLVFEHDLRAHAARKAKHLAGMAHVYENAYRKKNGDAIWFRVSSSPIFREGVFCGAIGLVVDITNERQAESRQRASDERLRIAFKTSPDAWTIVGCEDGKICEVNERMGEWYGYTQEEMIGHTTIELGMWAVPEVRQQLIETLKSQGRVENFEVLARRKNGETFWVSYSVSELYIDGTHLALEIIQDITETKQAAEALQASENRFRTLIEQAPVAIGVSRSTSIVYVNRKYRELFHIPESVNLIGCSILDHWSPESRLIIESFASQCTRGEDAPSEYEGIAMRSNGDPFPVRVAVTTVHLNDGVATVGFLMDLTEVRRAENALRQAEELYRGIFEGAAEGIFRTTPDGRVLTVNPTMARILAYESPAQLLEELTNTATLLWSTPGDRERFVCELEARNQVKNYVCQLRRRDGSLVWTLTNARRVTAPDGRSICYEGFISDITEKKQLEEQFLRVQRLESIGMLAAGIAHDLNNVLTPIKMAVPLLREMHTDPAEIQILKTLDASTERGVGLVRQILGFVRGVSGAPQLVQVKYLLQDIGDMITKTFPKSIQLSVSVCNDLWQVMANPTQLHQVVLNLCLNARDAMPQGGSLLLAAENRVLDAAAAAAIAGARPGAWLVLRVEDTGTGISPEILTRIWEPFFTTKQMGQGTGLGLSTVRGIVESHGGFIVVTTALGHGTAFQVFVPPVIASAENSLKTTAVSPPQGCGETILFVDDEEAIRVLVQRILVRAGYRVVLAENGAQALKIFEEHPDAFALIITDVEMPVMNGRALAKHIRTRAPHMKILMVSGLESQSAEEMWQPFANDFLQKPFVSSGLVATVKKILIHA